MKRLDDISRRTADVLLDLRLHHHALRAILADDSLDRDLARGLIVLIERLNQVQEVAEVALRRSVRLADRATETPLAGAGASATAYGRPEDEVVSAGLRGGSTRLEVAHA